MLRLTTTDASDPDDYFSSGEGRPDHLDLDQTPIDPRLRDVLDCVDAIRLGCVLMRNNSGRVTVAAMPHRLADAERELPWLVGLPVDVVACDCAAVARAIQRVYSPLDAAQSTKCA